jgi:prepilin-type N-terminal cleavage/methylation domain-containing protein
VSDARGFSLIEVAVATLIVAVALVPLVQLFPALIGEGATNETMLQLDAAAVRQMESLVLATQVNAGAVASGTTGCPDVPKCLLTWSATQEPASGAPGVGVLMDLSVTACVDANGNGTCDPGESQVRYDAKATSRP